MSSAAFPTPPEPKPPTWFLPLGILALLVVLGWYAFFEFVELARIDLRLSPGAFFLLVGVIPSTGMTILLLVVGFAAGTLRPSSKALLLIFVLLEVLGLALHYAAYVWLAGEIGSPGSSSFVVYDILVSASAMASASGLFVLLLIVLASRRINFAATPPFSGPPPP